MAFNETDLGPRVLVQGQWIRSQQNGSEAFAGPDWTGQVKDQFDTLGVGVKHAAIPNKLDIGADFTVSRSRSDISVDNAPPRRPSRPPRPASTACKLYGLYKLKDNLSITGSYAYEHYDSQDWQLDGITPSTVPGLLALGVQPPHYSVSVLRVALRYRF